MECEQSCVAAGTELSRASLTTRSSLIIYPDNVRGLVKKNDMVVPHSELAMHNRAAGKEIVAWVASCNWAVVAYKSDDGCGVITGAKNEVMSPGLIKVTEKLWPMECEGEKR